MKIIIRSKIQTYEKFPILFPNSKLTGALYYVYFGIICFIGGINYSLAAHYICKGRKIKNYPRLFSNQMEVLNC